MLSIQFLILLIFIFQVSTRWPGFYEGALHAGARAVADVMEEIGPPTGLYKGRAAAKADGKRQEQDTSAFDQS
jgi:hypothetical protein